MRTRTEIFAVFVLLFPATGFCQLDTGDGDWTYLFGGGGVESKGRQAIAQLGGGFEGLLSQKMSRHVGAGMELSILGPVTGSGGGRGFFSLDGSYHFLKAAKPTRLAPFLQFGYTRAFGPGSANLLNYGAGVNVWTHHVWGVRLEVRDHVQFSPVTIHFVSFRIAWVFVGPPIPTV